MLSPWSGSARTAACAALSTVAAFSLVAGLAGTAQAVSTAGDNAAKLTPKRIGSAPRIPAGAVRSGSVAADTTLHLAVNLEPRDPAALSAFVAQVADPKSANYHHYLATGQFASAFGPSKSTVDSVTQALRAAGLKPGALSKDGLSIPVTASVATASHALGTGFTNVKLSDGTESYLNTSAPSLPSGVAAEVSGITGLNNLSVMKSHHTTPVAAGKTTGTAVGSRALTANAAGPNFCASLTNLLKSNDKLDTRDYYSPSSLAAAYGLPHTTTAGTGTTVAVFELEDVLESAISDWKSCLGISSAWSTVTVDGGHTVTAAPTSGVGVEAALDIEDIMELAPGASVIDYEGPDADVASEQNVLDVYQQMVSDNKAQVLSSSWGTCDLNPSDAQLAAENNIFAEAAAQGQTVVSASGDAGSTDCNGDGGGHDASLAVDDPASQPYVTAVGGTWMNGSGSTLKQATWNYGASTGGAGGGGVSNRWNTGNGDLLYQTGFAGSGYSNTCSAASGQVCRQVPDVSALADPGAGYPITTGGGKWYILGGTSAAAPTWASIVALATTTADCKANGRVGQLNPIVYNAARSTYGSAFTDITSGNNDWTPSGYKGGKYAATAGYDMATGLGTPKYAGLVGQLCGTKASSAGGSFFPITPVRVFDTRAAYHVGDYTTPIPANTTYTATVTNNAAGDNVPATGVTAVALSVTAINPSTSSYVSVSGNGIGHGAATLTFVKGQTVPNAVVVPVTSSGKVDFYNRFGTVNVAAVVTGYFSSTGTGGSGFTPIPAAHMLDTRSGVGEPGGTAAKLGAGSTVTIKATDTPGIPAGVTALALNVTAINGTNSSYLGVYPSNAGPAAATSVSFAAKQILANTVIVPVDSDGNVTISNFAGTVDATADVTGYYSTTGGTSFNALAPTHLVDTPAAEPTASRPSLPVRPRRCRSPASAASPATPPRWCSTSPWSLPPRTGS
ncbi:protease pro-enzyme activation domain-containing protein [Streptacidiphilus sp. PAMC 29251]